MIDEIDYFPKRDQFKKKIDLGDDWNSLKKLKQSQKSKPVPKETTGKKIPDQPSDTSKTRPSDKKNG
jgi:hypothetical protein